MPPARPRLRPFIALTLLLLPALLPSPAQAGASRPPAQLLPGCTVFYAADGQTALGGNNEDFDNPLTLAWFIPASPGRFGRVYFGYDDYVPQGGINDQGVFFDGLALPYKATPLTDHRPHFPGGDLALMDELLARSAKVQDAIDLSRRWYHAGGEWGQNLLGDRFGDSVILDGDTVLRKQGAFQVATNFRLVDNPNPPYPDERYTTVSNMLSQADHFSVELFRQALQVAHAEGDDPTLYSQVYELKTGLIQLYQFHDFEHAVVINLASELAKGPHVVTIASLFPKNDELERWAAQQKRQWTADSEALVNKSIQPESQGWMSGDYILPGEADAGLARVYLEEEQLYLLRPNELPIPLYPTAPDTVLHHFFNGFDLTLTFQRDPSGQVTGAQGTFSFKPYDLSLPYNLTRAVASSPATGVFGAGLFNTGLLITVAAAGLVLMVLGSVLFVVRGRGRAARP